MRLRKENILVVDDDFDMLELLQRNLSLLHYHTYKASSVTEAIEILKVSERAKKSIQAVPVWSK